MAIEVTKEDRDLVMAIAMLVNDTGITIPERLRGAEQLCTRHRQAAYKTGHAEGVRVTMQRIAGLGGGV